MKTKLYYYYLDTSKQEESEIYKNLCEELKSKGLKLFDYISLKNDNESKKYWNQIKELNNKYIELDTTYIFDNQWNTNNPDLRIFDWQEEIFPNKKIKKGQYLEITAEIRQLRDNTFKCGYCGKQYTETIPEYCYNCLGSEYLKPGDLHLLKLKAISDNTPRPETVPEEIKTKYLIEQKKGRTKRLEQRKQDALKRIETDKENSLIEYNAFKWLIENNINYNNYIYYSHKNIFCFGWRNSIKDKEELKQQLNKFPYNYEIK